MKNRNSIFSLYIFILFFTPFFSFAQLDVKYIQSVIRKCDSTFGSKRANLYSINGAIFNEGKEIDSVLEKWNIDDIVNIGYFRPNELWKISFHQQPDHWFIYISLNAPYSKRYIRSQFKKIKPLFQSNSNQYNPPVVFIDKIKIEDPEIAVKTVLKLKAGEISSIFYYEVNDATSCTMNEYSPSGVVKIWTKRKR